MLRTKLLRLPYSFLIHLPNTTAPSPMPSHHVVPCRGCPVAQRSHIVLAVQCRVLTQPHRLADGLPPLLCGWEGQEDSSWARASHTQPCSTGGSPVPCARANFALAFRLTYPGASVLCRQAFQMHIAMPSLSACLGRTSNPTACLCRQAPAAPATPAAHLARTPQRCLPPARHPARAECNETQWCAVFDRQGGAPRCVPRGGVARAGHTQAC